MQTSGLEAILVLENGAVTTGKIMKYLKVTHSQLDEMIDQLNQQFKKVGSVIWVRKREEIVEFFIRSDFKHEFLSFYEQKKGKLKSAALETLAIIAYNQPITLPEIDDVRGVNSVNQLKFLLAEGLIATAGKKPTVGNPTLFKTTPHFLDRFNLKSVKDLPKMEEVKTYSFLED